MKILSLLLFCLALPAAAQTVEPFGNNAPPPTKELKPAGSGYNDNSWSGQRLVISLKGSWRFAPDPKNQGTADKWFAPDFNDGAWQVLQTGKTWKDQGVDFNGWGWYRQQIFVPKDFEGTALELSLLDTTTDDDAWFNGERIGGIHSEYKYENLRQRVYTVPAALIHYGALNTIAIRVWGGNLTFMGEASKGLVSGLFSAKLDPYGVTMRDPGGPEVPAALFDLSDAQRGHPFEIVFRFPGGMFKNGAGKLQCRLTDFYKAPILNAIVPVIVGPDGVARATVKVEGKDAETIYQRGRFKALLSIVDDAGKPLYSGTRDVDHLSFTKRELTALPALPEKVEDTSFGPLKLVDEIDCAQALETEEHPYLASGFDKDQMKKTPGSAVNVSVNEILGKKARESSEGWFAYRVGRGKLKPHTTYLLRIEYPEDKARYAPVEIQVGQNYLDVGWQNGINPDDPYDPWPLSHAWQWYDVVVPLDDETTGTGGAGSAPAENGFWVYFLNKVTPNKYHCMYEGGPAVARIKLYELDPEKNAPKIELPQGLPQRVLMFDWERGADGQPGDFVRYAKLMGYSAISPIILKWSFANYSPPLDGYDTIGVDAQNYWAHDDYTPGKPAVSPVPDQLSIHELYLQATKQYGIDYIPRFEYGGSEDLPQEARAIDGTGQPAKPNRFGTWCGDLLHPLTWDDIQKLMDHLIKPYAQDNPQLSGVLWRIRCDRMPVSYSRYDLDLFATETHTQLPPGTDAQQAQWASKGEGKLAYDDWWQQKRADFHARLAKLLQSYRPDLKLYYYNWDGDKFSLILNSQTAWAFLKQVAFAKGGDGRAVYEKDLEERKKLSGADYTKVMHSGDFHFWNPLATRIDYALRPELYRNIKGVELFAPANYYCFANDPVYLNYFQTAEGLAVSNCVPYDEVGSRTINPKYECNMITPAGGPFSMAFEVLSWFHGDARTMTYTAYTYGRGFADAHRRFAQAFRALPALPGTVVEQAEPQVKIRTYPSPNGIYVGVASRAFEGKTITVTVPGAKEGAKVRNLVTGEEVLAKAGGGGLQFELASGPMELNAFLVR